MKKTKKLEGLIKKYKLDYGSLGAVESVVYSIEENGILLSDDNESVLVANIEEADRALKEWSEYYYNDD